jgi:hypothetical protein
MTAGDPKELQTAELADRIRWAILSIVQAVMAAQLAALLFERQWLNGFLVALIMALSLAPVFLDRRSSVIVPAEFQALAIGFVFAALFLGEIRGYYDRIWWWDIALHVSSGLLLGIVGLLLVYVLNGTGHVERNLRPRFIAIFAFLFAVASGALWEMFEFGMDQGLDTQMQKPTPVDASGFTDTMWDMIADSIGAAAISIFAWRYMLCHEQFFIERWIRKFIQRNRKLFRRQGRR